MIAIGRSAGPARTMLLGSAAGLCFGVVAVLTKATTFLIGKGISVALTQWEPYVLIGVGILALVCSQSAYQAGPLAYSMPMIGVLEPATAVIIGTTALGEHISLAPGSIIVAGLGAAFAATGIVLLAHSPLVHSVYVAQGLDQVRIDNRSTPDPRSMQRSRREL